MFTTISFLIPTPASTKNSRRIFKAGNGRPIVAKSAAAIQSIRQIKAHAYRALQCLGAHLESGSSLFGDDDIRVSIQHLVEEEVVLVKVSSAGPRPRGKTGRKRDLQNLQEGILDALQGILFDNDNQVVELMMHRHPKGIRSEHLMARET